MIWTESLLSSTQDKIIKLSQNSTRYFCFVHPWELTGENKEGFIFNPEYFENISNICGDAWQQVYLHESLDKPCLYIVTAHGSDFSAAMWELRAKSNDASVFVLWHFDNHMAYLGNFKSAISADLNFLSHNLGAESYLLNPVSPLAGHIPACTSQFGPKELRVFQSQFTFSSRISKALFNYVIYDVAPRSTLIKNLSHQLTDIADFKLMPSEDRTRYWKMSRSERYAEWASYKCSLIIPIVNDLSTRVFDCLATGMIPIVPYSVEDLNLVISSQDQARLGIVRISDFNVETIREAITHAIDLHNRYGEEGINSRIDYIVNNATLGHRVNTLLNIIDDISIRKSNLVFGKGPNGIGSYVVNT